ncbi:MAG: branched-chain alpha-keto acid dehydrogenase subunit E2 [Rhizobiales bacterium 63-7]|nr:2-oxo acid dehydrogenase subunit E2 [Hyphomicrobiales bacterium]OJU68135.1 MAG: branched-chain alpha-keto acid dehydrogenase subunit E2 [Rhizobiales bacterium 63-7]
MGIYSIRLPDIGEGIAEAELVEWLVNIGDEVREDDLLAAVMTDKATVEIPTSISGKVVWLGSEPGTLMAIGSELIRLEIDGAGNMDEVAQASTEEAPAPKAEAAPEPEKPPIAAKPATVPSSVAPAPARPEQINGPLRPEGEKPLASPAVRTRARAAGIDLRRVRGTAPGGRITHEDLDGYFASGGQDSPVSGGGKRPKTDVSEIKVIGLRRKIAERMSLANRNIPHISSVEEVDVTALEELRARLNAKGDRTKLTVLPFLMQAMVRTLADLPVCNAHYDDEAGIVRRFGAVHIGVATQTGGGLLVPVVRHAEANSLWGNADEVLRVSKAARDGTASRDELTGSTITLTSLGALGGIVFTPIINHPEVAIVGVNKMAIRPVWDATTSTFVPRKMINLSCSFDHRIVDGYDAAVFINRMKELLENPALLFLET